MHCFFLISFFFFFISFITVLPLLWSHSPHKCKHVIGQFVLTYNVPLPLQVLPSKGIDNENRNVFFLHLLTIFISSVSNVAVGMRLFAYTHAQFSLLDTIFIHSTFSPTVLFICLFVCLFVSPNEHKELGVSVEGEKG